MYGNTPMEQKHMQFQVSARTLDEAERRFERSCATICGCRSTHMDCKNCGVYRTHVRVINDLLDREEEMERKFLEAAKIAKATGCAVVVV